MNREEQAAAIEAILFVAGTGVELEVLAQALGITQLEISALADELIQKKDDARGLEFSRTDDLLQLRTKKKYAGYVRDALKPVARKTLSRSVLETDSIGGPEASPGPSNPVPHHRRVPPPLRPIRSLPASSAAGRCGPL